MIPLPVSPLSPSSPIQHLLSSGLVFPGDIMVEMENKIREGKLEGKEKKKEKERKEKRKKERKKERKVVEEVEEEQTNDKERSECTAQRQ